MKRRDFISVLLILNIAALCVSLCCCSDLKLNDSGTYINFSAQTRTVFPKVNSVNELGLFSLTKIEKCMTEANEVKEVAEEICTWTNYSDFASAQIEIVPGIYSFVLDSSYCGTKYVCRIDDVEILPQTLNTLNFKLEVTEYSKETKGSVDIALLLPRKSGYNVTACLLDSALQELEAYPEKSISVNEYANSQFKAFYTADNVQSGTYFIRFCLFKDGIPLNTVYESVTVADSLVSEGSVELTESELEKLYYVDLIIPSNAVLNEGSFNYCFSRHKGLTLPVASDFVYDGFEFVGWKKVIPDGINFTLEDGYSVGVEDGTIGNFEYIAVFRPVHNEVEEPAAEEPPAEEPPAEEPPAEEPPAEEPPAEETPSEEQGGQTPQETPAEEPPVEETPAEEQPAEEPPAEEPPAEEPPAEETPSEEQGGQTPQETPAEEPPVVETPAEEPPAEETPSEEQGGQTPQETPAEEPPVEETPAEEQPAEEQGGQTPAETPSAEEPAEETPQQIYSINEEDYYRIGKIGRYSDYTDNSEYDYIGLLTFDGKTLVTAIENASVQNSVQLEIPEGIEKISGKAFTESLKISTAVIGPDVKCIEPHAFKNCQNMYAVTLPDDNCSWYITSHECTTDAEIRATGSILCQQTIWNNAILLKSDYEGMYWYKIDN